MTNEHIIKLRGVRRIYRLEGEEVRALDGVDLDIIRGEYLSIMGPSGSGKTTLFNMIGGLDRPSAGSVLLEDEDIARLSASKLAWLRSNRIGYVFQSFNLILTETAVGNVSLPLIFSGVSETNAWARAEDVLCQVGLSDRLYHRPAELSGGQQQRVAIARALVNRPTVILADEPTGNLDLRTGEEILALLKKLQQRVGATVICATHDHKMLAASDRVVWMQDGRIVRTARREELNIDIGSMDGQVVV